MILPRIIPCLLLKGKGLVKGIRFKDHTYVGDPINAIKIFNDMEVDELIFLDINATKEDRIPDLDLVQTIADQCLMPFAVGGGISTVQHVRDILSRGAEKICINTSAIRHPEVITQISETFGTQAVIVSVDFKKNWRGRYETYIQCGSKFVSRHPVDFAQQAETLGAGEILINSIDRDGTQSGFDIEIVKQVSDAVNIPVIACGGAGSNEDLVEGLIAGHASAVAAGTLLVFHGRHRAVLLNFPSKDDREWIYRNAGTMFECNDRN